MKQFIFRAFQTLLLLSLVFFSNQLFAQKSKKTTKTTKTVTKTTTTTTSKKAESKTTESKTTESKLSPEELKKAEVTLGKKLSSLVKADSMKANSSGGITVRRYISNEEEKIGADIFDINSDSKLSAKSIENVLSNYIKEQFEYDGEDSELLSELIIKFNIKNRNNQDYLIKNFSTNVVLATKKDKIGLSESATPEKIAGQTQIIIPTEKNILKAIAIDIASLELADVLKNDLAIKKESNETLAQLNAFLSRKTVTEKEELNNKIVSASPAEVKGLTERLTVLKRREEMRKLNMTSEKEYLALQESKKPSSTNTTTSNTSSKTTTTISTNTGAVNAPEPPKDKYTTFIHGENHPGINAREIFYIPGSGVLAIGYSAAQTDKKELQLFLTNPRDFMLKKSSEGIKLAPESPLVYSNGKIYVLELLKNEAYLVQFTNELEFELRAEVSVNPKSTIQVVGEEIIVTAIEKTGKNDTKVFKVKDLSFLR